MTYAAENTASATLSGRELALKRRQAMALHGKAALARPNAAVGRPATVSVSASNNAAPAMPTADAAASAVAAPASASDAELIERLRAASVKKASRLRREALSQVGKAALPQAAVAAARPSGRVRALRPVEAAGLAPAVEAGVSPSGCGCGCNGASGGCSGAVRAEAEKKTDVQGQAYGMRAATEVAPGPVVKPVEVPTGRALARARRAALARDGKAGLKRVAQAAKIAAVMPNQDWQAAIAKGATGRQIAMQRRMVQSLTGRIGPADNRPSGRMRARNVQVPVKVEEGHTLAGQTVTGTMVERSPKVTGNEPGACRVITGTEYIGSEQYETLCQTRPEPGPAKVGVSTTLRSHKVTGTEVGRSAKVTGDEPGACRAITGTEYLSAERYDEFCAARPAPAPEKVAVTRTDKGLSVTGVLVGRSPKVTGDEPGADRAITGTRYAQPATDTGPDKVVLTHTAGGKPVTGTAVGHSAKITGDEPGACRGITGTQYLAAEQYQEFCHSAPPAVPRKVSVMSTRGEQAVSGTEVGRSPKVTGDEPGACRTITGTQYYNAADFADLCAVAGPRKVAQMHTLSGRRVTGTEVDRSPKMSGDVEGGCIPVTGTDYAGLPAQCAGSTPIPPAAKVAVDQTWRGQPVTGSYVGRSAKVTGNEPGACRAISGTPYVGRSQYSDFCPAPALEAQTARVRMGAPVPAAVVTGDRPGAGGSVMTGDERGACEAVTGTPYIGPDNAKPECLVESHRFVPRARAFEEPARPPAPTDFSIKSPAREAWERRYAEITGTAYSSERITGPVNKAHGLITGTPEFRHASAATQQAQEAERIASARRLTGEGSQQGPRITGDAWHAQSRVTGTEGASSLARNVSLRGEPRGAGVNAWQFRELERPPVPESKITGSSGNTTKGALVTVSGGARA